MTKKKLLIIFVKNPELGKCKTRLAATIGNKKALKFYKSMLLRTRNLAQEVDVDKAVFYSSFVDETDLWPNNPPFYKYLQHSNPDLGIKMQDAFERAFATGYESVCIIGSDCYKLGSNHIEEAFASLEENDAVLGPSNDGGYYLLGMNQLYENCFVGKKWSTETVAADTINDFKRLNLSYNQLEELVDIDNEEDLQTIPEDEIESLLA